MTPQEALNLARARDLPGLVFSLFDRSHIDTHAFELPVDIPFPIASVTKPLTAHLVLEAAAAGRLDLDAPIVSQLPAFALADPQITATLTPRDALCHYSGLPPHTWAWVYGEIPRDRFIRERLPHLECAGPHRERHRYSNLLYAVLGALLEHATGQSWESLLADTLVRPLGLETLRPLDASWAARCAPPHARHPLRRIPPFVAAAGHLIAPASELESSVPDLARLGQFFLGLPPQDPRWLPHNRVPSPPPHPALTLTEYALGWRVDHPGGQRRVWHSGQCSGYSLLLSLYPDRGHGFAAAVNASGATAELHGLDLALSLGLAIPEFTIQTNHSSVEEPRGPAPVPGEYLHPGYGGLRIRSRDGRLWATFQNAPESPLREAPGGGMLLVLPPYDAAIPIWREGDALRAAFERGIAPPYFQRVR